MRNPCLFVLMTITAILRLSYPSSAAVSVPVTGRVLDAQTAKPVAGALIGVYESGRKEVRTDSHGRFKVLADPGKRIIYYEGGNPLYRSSGSTYTSVTVPAKGLSGVVLKLWRVNFTYGKVFMPSGMPLVGAAVTLNGAYTTRAATDSNGKFKIEIPEEESKPGG